MSLWDRFTGRTDPEPYEPADLDVFDPDEVVTMGTAPRPLAELELKSTGDIFTANDWNDAAETINALVRATFRR